MHFFNWIDFFIWMISLSKIWQRNPSLCISKNSFGDLKSLVVKDVSAVQGTVFHSRDGSPVEANFFCWYSDVGCHGTFLKIWSQEATISEKASKYPLIQLLKDPFLYFFKLSCFSILCALCIADNKGHLMNVMFDHHLLEKSAMETCT